MHPEAVASMLLAPELLTLYRRLTRGEKWLQVVEHYAERRCTIRKRNPADEDGASREHLNRIIDHTNCTIARTGMSPVFGFVLAHALYEYSEALAAMRGGERSARN